MGKTLFISAGPETWGSSRMRCHWPSKYMNADVIVWEFPKEMEVRIDQYDAFIFQKYGSPDIQRQFIEAGKQVWLDQCDPMWWFSDQVWMRAMFQNATGAVFSSEALKNDFLEWWGAEYNAYVIPDRLETSHFNRKHEHMKISPVRFIWYGVAQNRIALSGVWANMSRLKAYGHNVSLTIMDDRPDIHITEQNDIPILYARWEIDKEVPLMAAHDVALLPPYPGPWGKVKSNNKTVTAWACNLAVTDGMDYKELVKIVTSHEYRKRLAELGSATLDQYDVRLSAKEWEVLLA